MIAFEWWEWTGKTTQIEKVKEYLQNNWKKVFTTREPGGNNCHIAEKIRDLLKDPKNKNMTALTELFLFLASRAQHTEEIIIPKIKQGYIVITDRFFGSTISYQHYARWLFDYDFIKNLNEIAIKWTYPDITFYLDVEPEIWLKRKKELQDCRLDAESLNFHKKVREWFLQICKKENHWYTIDASKDINKVFSKIKEQLELQI